MYKYVSQDSLLRSFKEFESYVSMKVKSGDMSNHEARRLINDARKNYKNQNLNRELDKINAGNTKESILHI